MGEQEGEQDAGDKYDVIGPEEGTAICTDPEHPVAGIRRACGGRGELSRAGSGRMHDQMSE